MHLFKTTTTAAMIAVFALLAHAAPAPVDHVPAAAANPVPAAAANPVPAAAANPVPAAAANPVPAAAAAAVDSVAAVTASTVGSGTSPKKDQSLPTSYGCPWSSVGCTNKCKALDYKLGSCTGFFGFSCTCKDS
ncbi:hypothetical protein BGZ81_005153 [Podila clonocystis]|nr:hypothetical protein BGZ81_005153 [Podila clonocystis]